MNDGYFLHTNMGWATKNAIKKFRHSLEEHRKKYMFAALENPALEKQEIKFHTATATTSSSDTSISRVKVLAKVETKQKQQLNEKEDVLAASLNS